MDDAMEVMEHTAVQVIETMRASYHEAKITLPERFELDLLDLGVLDEGDTVSPHQHSMSKEELKDDRSSRPSFLNERFFDEVMGHSDYNFAAFTPLADVLPSGLMDIDLGRSEAYNTSTFVTMEKHQEVSCDIRESEHMRIYQGVCLSDFLSDFLYFHLIVVFVQDLCSHEDGIDVKGHGWSVRTRAAAQYLYNRFLELRERKHELTLSFSQILEGKTRPKCAIFFYETLNLKTRGFIDVRQDFPYGDIIISAASLLETFQ